jgi:molybdopterin/thiamine biosynthesis adenylyltransferase
MWESDRERLAIVEADIPDPRSIHYSYEAGSVVVFADADVAGSRAGFLRLDATELAPLRAAVTEVRATVPAVSAHAPGRVVATFAGDTELRCPWRRLREAPPLRDRELARWLVDEHDELVLAQLRYAREMVKLGAPPDLPALIAFVYPDEGPERGQVHDAWLLVAIDPRGRLTLPRVFHLRREDRWLRQPQLEPLGGKRVSIVGLGSLGSPIADLLAKAGIGGLHYVDYDTLGVGNRVRHQLDLGDLGRGKADAMEARTARVDPWVDCRVHDGPLGEVFGGSLAAAGQHVDDLLVGDLARSDLIVNASADPVAGAYLSRIACETGTPVVHAWVSAGAWGARLLVQRPGESGCWDCLALTQADRNDRVPPVSSDPEASEVAERGCADATFTGPGFEIAAAAAAAARVVVQVLLEEAGGYPRPHFDLLTLGFRSTSSAEPESHATRLTPHPRCPTCSTSRR